MSDNCLKKKCGCQDSFLTTPPACPEPFGCPDPEPCSEVFNSLCIVYTGDPILCNGEELLNTGDTVHTLLQDLANYMCTNTLIIADILCDTDVVVAANTTVVDAIQDVVDYFCELTPNQVIVEAGDNITVTENTVGVVTTYTVSTETPALRKFVYEETLPSGNPDQQITIFNTIYAPCGIPTVGCDGTLTAVPTVVDLIIQGYWFNVDLNYWIEFTHTDKTLIYVDASGNIGIFPAFSPVPVDLDLPVRIRITIIG